MKCPTTFGTGAFPRNTICLFPTLKKVRQELRSTLNTALLIIIVPFRHSIGKCFLCFFPYALKYKIYSLKLYHIKHLHIKSKASAYMYRHLLQISYTNALDIRTCFRFHMQMRVEKKPNAFAYRIYSHFTQQCMLRPYLKIWEWE